MERIGASSASHVNAFSGHLTISDTSSCQPPHRVAPPELFWPTSDFPLPLVFASARILTQSQPVSILRGMRFACRLRSALA